MTAQNPATAPVADAQGTDPVAEATALYRGVVGSEPEGVWSAPGRANLIGEHTDYNLGFVLPFAIDRRTAVAAAKRTDGVIRLSSTFAADAVEFPVADLAGLAGGLGAGLRGVDGSVLPGWTAYPLGVLWSLGEQGEGFSSELPFEGVELHLASTVPVGAGLSSSAAIECAVALAVNDLWQLGLDRTALAKVGQRAENVAVGAPTGIMDQTASLKGRVDSAVFLDCRSLESEVVELGFTAAGLEILVIDSKVEHAHATGGYAARRASCEKGAELMGVASLRELTVDDLTRAETTLDDETFRRVRHIITENQRVLDTVALLREGGARNIGALLEGSHVSMRDDFEISTPELDLAVETAVAAGAAGARMTGGGFGGSVIAVTPRELVPAVSEAVAAAYAEHGYAAPQSFTVTATEGARRDA